MVFGGIHSNPSEINVMKDHQTYKWAICPKNTRLEAPWGGPMAGPEGVGWGAAEEHPRHIPEE